MPNAPSSAAKARGGSTQSLAGSRGHAALAHFASRWGVASPSQYADPIHRNLARLQRTSGNQAVVRAIESRSIQAAEVENGAAPNGPTQQLQEQQADRVSEGLRRRGAARENSRMRGTTLPSAARKLFESRFGGELSGVRIHADSSAAASARALGANAFTFGSDIVFGPGMYAPDTEAGRRLLAHELTHVMQQRAGGAVVQRKPKDQEPAPAKEPEVFPGEFGPKYQSKKSHGQQSYEDYQAAIGTNDLEPPIQQAHEFGGTKLNQVPISIEELKEILNPPGKGHDDKLDRVLEGYLERINMAFAVAQMDTVESQALYLAHSAGETGSFRKLEEKTIQQKKYAGFEGRGSVQVTGEPNYVQTLAYLERDAELLRKSPKQEDRYHAAWAQWAVDSIKANPKAAADEKFAFLFSGAYMQMAGGIRRSALLTGQNPTFPGTSYEDSWVSGKNHEVELKAAKERLATAKAKLDEDLGNKEHPELAEKSSKALTKAQKDVQEWESTISRSAIKSKTYKRAVEVLRKRAADRKPAGK